MVITISHQKARDNVNKIEKKERAGRQREVETRETRVRKRKEMVRPRWITASMLGGGGTARSHLRQPVALRSTCEVWRCSLRSSWWLGEESQLEWGMMTLLVSTASASWMMGIFRASQDERFHSTPASTQAQDLDLTAGIFWVEGSWLDGWHVISSNLFRSQV